jgi:hypothetical protein
MPASDTIANNKANGPTVTGPCFDDLEETAAVSCSRLEREPVPLGMKSSTSTECSAIEGRLPKFKNEVVVLALCEVVPRARLMGTSSKEEGGEDS